MFKRNALLKQNIMNGVYNAKIRSFFMLIRLVYSINNTTL